MSWRWFGRSASASNLGAINKNPFISSSDLSVNDFSARTKETWNGVDFTLHVAGGGGFRGCGGGGGGGGGGDGGDGADS